MADLGTVSIVVDVRGQPLVRQLGTDLEKVAVAENKVSDGAKEVIRNFQSVRDIQRQVAASTNAASNAFQRFSTRELQQASDRLQNYEYALANTRQGMNSFGVVTQQAGYQIGDFLVQVQSGTSVFVAMGQQLTQLVGVLPMMTGFMGLSTSALVGLSAGLGIAIPLITAFAGFVFNAAQNLGASSEKIKEYQNAIDSLNSSIQQININLEGFKRGVDDDNIVAAQVAIEDLKNSLFELRNTEVSGFLDTFTRAGNIAEQQAILVELEKQLEVYRQQSAEEERLAAAASLRANEFRDSVREEFLERERIKKAHADAVQSMGEALNNQRLMNIAAEEALAKYSMMRTVAAGVANELARGASAAFAMAQQNIAAAGKVYGAVGARGNPATSNQQGYGQFSYTGPRLDANNNPIASSGRGSSREQESALERLQEQLALEKDLVGTSEAYQRVRRALGEDFATTSPMIVENLIQQIESNEQLLELEKQREQLMNQVESSLENGFMAMVEGTKSVKDAFKQMAYEIIKELYRVLVVQRLVGGITGSIGMFTGASTGSFGLPFGRESGGTMMAGKPYLVGERGPELVIPRHSGTVVNANQTASALSGGGSITVQNNISVTGSDAAMVRAEVAKMIPQITNATKAAVIDAKQRGGQMAAAFR